jgi:hypothetical protein
MHLGDSVIIRLGDSVIIRLGDSVIIRLGDSVVIRLATGRLGCNIGDDPTGRLGDVPVMAVCATPNQTLICSSYCHWPVTDEDSMHPGPPSRGQHASVQHSSSVTCSTAVLLGVPARPMFVDMHANTNVELLGRPPT